MTDKRYTVISAQTPRGPEYRIYDRINECSIEGGFDTQKWAETGGGDDGGEMEE